MGCVFFFIHCRLEQTKASQVVKLTIENFEQTVIQSEDTWIVNLSAGPRCGTQANSRLLCTGITVIDWTYMALVDNQSYGAKVICWIAVLTQCWAQVLARE